LKDNQFYEEGCIHFDGSSFFPISFAQAPEISRDTNGEKILKGLYELKKTWQEIRHLPGLRKIRKDMHLMLPP
jgi:hypothetical protein